MTLTPCLLKHFLIIHPINIPSTIIFSKSNPIGIGIWSGPLGFEWRPLPVSRNPQHNRTRDLREHFGTLNGRDR